MFEYAIDELKVIIAKNNVILNNKNLNDMVFPGYAYYEMNKELEAAIKILKEVNK